MRGNWKLRPGHVKAWLQHRLPLIPSPIVGIVNTQDIFLARCTGEAPSNATSHNRLWCRKRLILALPIRPQQRSKFQMSSFTRRSPRPGYPGDSVHRLVMLVLILEFLVSETTYDMIVYHANGLHERVTNCCPNELEPSFLQIFAHGFRLRRA